MRFKIELIIVLLTAEVVGIGYVLVTLWGLLAYPDDVVDICAGIGMVIVLIVWIEIIIKHLKYLSKQKTKTNEKQD